MQFEVSLAVSTSLHYDMVNFFFMGILFTSIKFGIFSGSSYGGNMSSLRKFPLHSSQFQIFIQILYYGGKNLMVHPLHVGLILKEFYYIRSYAFSYISSIQYMQFSIQKHCRNTKELSIPKNNLFYIISQENKRGGGNLSGRHFGILQCSESE